MNKALKILMPLVLIMSSHAAYAWDTIAPNTYAIYGDLIIDSGDNFEQTAELVYNSEYKSFGISFIDKNKKRKTMPYGVFRFKSCGMDTVGAIAGHLLKDPEADNQLTKIFKKCDRPAYLRIWNTTNNYALYKFEGSGPIKEK